MKYLIYCIFKTYPPLPLGRDRRMYLPTLKVSADFCGTIFFNNQWIKKILYNFGELIANFEEELDDISNGENSGVW